MEKVTKSLKFDKELWKEMKIHCTQKDISISEFVEDLVKKELKKR